MPPIHFLLYKLWNVISIAQQRSILALLVLSILCGALEVAMLGIAAPFFSILTGNAAAENTIYRQFLSSHTLTSNDIAAIFLFVSAVTTGARLALLYFTNKIGFKIGADLGVLIYRQSLLQPLELQKNKSSSEIIAAASEKSHVIVYNVIVAILQLCGSTVVFASIATALFLFNPWITINTIILFSGFYLLIVLGFRGDIARSSKDLASFQTKLFRALQEGIGSKRDVILHKAENYYCNMYTSAIIPLRRAQGKIHFAIQAPRFIIESAVVISIGGIFIIINNASENFSSTLPLLGVFALGGLKLLPITQQIYAASTAIVSSTEIMHDVLGDLKEKKKETAKINPTQSTKIYFSQKLELSNVSFSYIQSTHKTLSRVSMQIKKGERIAIIGPSGGGKSTLADLLLGLLPPSDGYMMIDNTTLDETNINQWHDMVAHVPQDIYLADSTITENIAIAIPYDQIDMLKVKKAAELAKISSMIETLADGYNFMVGEGGNRLSGGQKQRIAIARALYRGAQFLVLDEATSALDEELENELLATIHNIPREITIVMVTHNLKSTSEFDKVYSINSGTVTQVSSAHKKQIHA